MISSTKNPLVKQMRRLHRAKARHEQNLFLLEGTHLLESACSHNCALTTLCYTQQWQQRHPQLCHRAVSLAQRSELVTETVVAAMTTTVNPNGVVAIAPRSWNHQPTATNFELGLAVERLQDPGNLGTIIRTAAAVGVDSLWLSADSVDPDHPKVLRASAGAWFQVKMAVFENLNCVLTQAQEQGIQVVATSLQATCKYWEVDLKQPTIFVVGNEGAGLSADLLSQAHQQVKIPLRPGVESLNVAVATALLLYEAQRQRDGFNQLG